MATPAKVEIKVTADAAGAVRDLDKVAKELKGVGDTATTAGKETDKAFDNVDTKKAQGQLADLSEATQETEGAFGDLAGSLAGFGPAAVAGMGLAAITGAVAVTVAKMQELFGEALDFEVGRDKLQAQLGLSTEDARIAGQKAADLYSGAWGESISEVNDAIRLVAQNLDMAVTDEAIQGITGSVLDLATTFEQDLGGTTRALGQLMRTGLVADAQEGLDLMTRSFQVGNDKAEDLLDTINEYSTSFRVLGLRGDQSMGLIRQGLQGGARDADQVADALKEFGIRAQDGSKATADAFRDLGLDADNMSKKIAGGGPAAAEGLRLVLDIVRDIEDPLKRTQVTTALFGTQSEDMAAALGSLDVTTAVDELGKLEGAAKTMGDGIADNATTKWESWKRTLETNVVTFLADTVIPKLTEFGDKVKPAFDKAAEAAKLFFQVFTGEEATVDLGAWTGPIENMATLARDLKDTILPFLSSALHGASDALERFFKVLQDNEDLLLTVQILLGTIAVIVAGMLAAALLGFIIVMGIVAASVGIAAGAIWLLIQAFQFLKDLAGTVQTAVENALTSIGAAAEGLWEDFTNGLDNLERDVQDVWNNITGIVTRAIDTIKGYVNVFINGWNNLQFSVPTMNLPDFLGGPRGGFTVTMPYVRPLAEGGLVRRPTVALVGEAGPEAVVPLRHGVSMGGDTHIHVNVSHTGLAVDSPKLQRDIVDALRRWEKREGPAHALGLR